MTWEPEMKITRGEYQALLGLKFLATKHNDALEDIQDGIRVILNESKHEADHGGGWSGELAFTSREVDDVLSIMNIEVEDE